MKITDRYILLTQHLDLEAAAGVPDARWEYFQLALFLDDSTFRSDNKARQIAYSFAIAADGMADAILSDRDSIYVSINQREAQEKIRYALAVYENIQGIRLPRIKRETQQEIEFTNGVRLTSLPAQKPRGRARSNVYLDEFAHVRDDAEIYTAALPITSKGGRIRMGSSPFGASGRFWEIHNEEIRPYPGYSRQSTPWWETYSFCINPVEARRLAPAMETGERVELFGNDRIKAIYANIPLEDFQQEYEAAFVDESRAWITWEEISRSQDPGLFCEIAEGRPGNLQQAFESTRAVQLASVQKTCEASLCVGVDVGRTRNTTEIYAIGWSPANVYPLRLAITLDGVDFDDQEAVIADVLDRLPVATCQIDRNGLGMNLAENLAKAYPGKVQGVDFTNGTKTVWATDAKTLIQQGKTPIPVDRDLAYQIHSIKRRVTPSKNMIFDTETNEKHHADKFWAWALALAGTQGDRLEPAGGTLRAAFAWAQEAR